MNDEFKKDFWDWLKNNTYFYLSRNHHKDDIDNAIDYCFFKLGEMKNEK